MAERVHLFLKANGKDILGDSSQHSHGRENSIECLYTEFGARAARNPANGQAVGGSTFDPVTVRKYLDRATPELIKAMCNNEQVEAEFRFYRPDEHGNTDHFFTIRGENGRIAHVSQSSPEASNPSSCPEDPSETIGFVFEALTWDATTAGKQYRYSWKDRN